MKFSWNPTRIPVKGARFQLDVEPVMGAEVDEVVARFEPVYHTAIEFI